MALPTWLTPSHGIILGLLLVFAIVHSGLAALRPWGENKIGPRPYRVMFFLINIPLSVILIIYFFNHRYDGLILWKFQRYHGVKALVWFFSAISFLFLYPATFNILEIAAISKPQVHLYETGILRICRHPQMVGQVIWCIAHTLWIGTTFTVVTSLGLVAHHLFAVWHGDYRLEKYYGEAFIHVKKRTSIIPFLAIFEGRQTIKLQEFFKPAYLGILIVVELFWWGHPWLVQITSQVNW
ncbi:MAG: NnrU family protein [cyanobacterium endosymbiont of Rhopalodia sterrenbergii]